MISLQEVQQRINPRHTMPEAQAPRSLLVEAAQQAVQGIGDVPDMVSMKVFLERYQQSKKVAEIAEELGVSHRENYVNVSVQADDFEVNFAYLAGIIKQSGRAVPKGVVCLFL